jgi:hypothetical protein
MTGREVERITGRFMPVGINLPLKDERITKSYMYLQEVKKDTKGIINMPPFTTICSQDIRLNRLGDPELMTSLGILQAAI